jgi:hypothetical protein
MLLAYNTVSEKRMTMSDLWLINSDGEIGELFNIFKNSIIPGGDEVDDEKRNFNLRMMRNKHRKSNLLERVYTKYGTRDPKEVW